MVDGRSPARLLWALLLMVLSGCDSTHASIGYRPGFRSFTLPEITRDVRIAERFNVRDGALEAIDLYPVRVSAPKGSIHIDLWPVAFPGAPPLRTADVNASDLVRNPTYRFAFAPLRLPPDMCCVVEISSQGDSTGVALRANQAPPEPADFLVFNGRTRWAQLAFQARFTRQPLRASAGVAIAALLCAWVGVIVLVVLISAPRSAWSAPVDGQSPPVHKAAAPSSTRA